VNIRVKKTAYFKCIHGFVEMRAQSAYICETQADSAPDLGLFREEPGYGAEFVDHFAAADDGGVISLSNDVTSRKDHCHLF
jgi:hypothetical protein